jgi:hypothetical protein
MVIKWFKKTFGKDSVYNSAQKKLIASMAVIKVTMIVAGTLLLIFSFKN